MRFLVVVVLIVVVVVVVGFTVNASVRTIAGFSVLGAWVLYKFSVFRSPLGPFKCGISSSGICRLLFLNVSVFRAGPMFEFSGFSGSLAAAFFVTVGIVRAATPGGPLE